eukprot:m.97131 g.97131  ORF g.97131 m.97131 type:complete len:466 (-) comp8816_c0_seq1:472-1869(-)
MRILFCMTVPMCTNALHPAHLLTRLLEDKFEMSLPQIQRIARSLGFISSDPCWKQGLIRHALQQRRRSGHCGIPIKQLLEETRLCEEDLEHAQKQGIVQLDTVRGAQHAMHPRLAQAEREIARLLLRRKSQRPSWSPEQFQLAVARVVEQGHVLLSDEQASALDYLAAHHFGVLTGGPGVGKTRIMDVFVQALRALDKHIILCAPTGRAAQELSFATGEAATTIHALLEMQEDGTHRRTRSTPLNCDMVIVDEASMLDIELFQALLWALPETASLLIVGDADQLPSVSPGNVLGDIIESGVVPVQQLTTIYRQARQSDIIQSSRLIKDGKVPELGTDLAKSDFVFVPVEEPQHLRARLLQLVSSEIPEARSVQPRDIQVMSPMNTRGAVSVERLNQHLQRLLNPESLKPAITIGATTFRLGDKVCGAWLESDKRSDTFALNAGHSDSKRPLQHGFQRRPWHSILD